MASPALILLHGALGSKDQFIELKEYLAPHFDVHAFDFSGHGGLPIVETFSMDLFCHDLLEFIQLHNLHLPNVFGYSMGGYVALHCAAKFPGTLGRIMTLGTKMQWDPTIAAAEIKMLHPERIEEKIPAFGEMLRKRHAPADWKENMAFTAVMMTNLGNGLALDSTDLALIANEALLCLGEQDQMVTREETIWAADHLENGHYRIIPGWKHPIESVDKPALADLIRRYMVENRFALDM